MPDDAPPFPADQPHHTVAGRPWRDLGALQTAELFVLSAIRLWCRAGEDQPCRRALVRNGFQAVNLSCAHYAAFARLMTGITGGWARDSRRPFTTALSGRAPVMHDEAWLLECFALSQHHRSSEVIELLSALLPAAAVRAAAEALDGLAAALTGVGLHLRIRSLARPEIHPARLWRHSLWRHSLSRMVH